MDDQQLKDRDRGQKIREILMKVNTERPPMDFRKAILYVPLDDAGFWQEVAQRIRLMED